MNIKVEVGPVKIELEDGDASVLGEVFKTVCDYFYTLEKFEGKLKDGMPDFDLFNSQVKYPKAKDELVDSGNPLPLEGSIPITGDIHKIAKNK